MLKEYQIDGNKYRKIYVVSDIHNDFDSFVKGIDELQIGKDDLLIVLGDIFDRGQSR